MPRFAANLGYLFTERPLLERIDVAAAAGFKAIELQFPYDVPADAVKAAIERNRITILGLNTAPGREGRFRGGGRRGPPEGWERFVHRGDRVGGGNGRGADPLPPRQGCTRAAAGGGPRLSRQSRSSGRHRRREKNQTADRADQRPGQAELFSQ